MDNSSDKHFEGFKEIWRHIKEAMSGGICQSVLLSYFFFVIILCGGSGLWETIAASVLNKHLPNCLMAFNTVALSVASAACVDLLFSKNSRPLQALGLMFGGVMLVLHVLSLLSHNTLWFSWPCTIIAWLLAHIAWLIVNAHNPNLFDGNPDDSSGGPTSRDLARRGEYKGLKV